VKTIFNTTITDLVQIGTICLYLRENWFTKLIVIAFRLDNEKPKTFQVDSNKKVDRVSKFLMENWTKGKLKIRVEAN